MFPWESRTRITSLGRSEVTVRVVTLPLSSSLVSDEATELVIDSPREAAID